MIAVQKNIPLRVESEPIVWPETHYIFVERRGSIPDNAPQAWNELHPKIPTIAQHNSIIGYMSLYQINQGIYRAGWRWRPLPSNFPPGSITRNSPEASRGSSFSRGRIRSCRTPLARQSVSFMIAAYAFVTTSISRTTLMIRALRRKTSSSRRFCFRLSRARFCMR